jgi:hypothetical protein
VHIPNKLAHGTVFDPPRDRDALEPNIGLTVSLTAAQPEEPNRIRTGRTARTGVCPKHGDGAARSHGTFLNVAHDPMRKPLPVHYISWDHPSAQESTNQIRHQACGRWERPGRRCAGGMELFRCRRRGLQENFPGYSAWVRHREWGCCSRARIVRARTI